MTLWWLFLDSSLSCCLSLFNMQYADDSFDQAAFHPFPAGMQTRKPNTNKNKVWPIARNSLRAHCFHVCTPSANTRIVDVKPSQYQEKCERKNYQASSSLIFFLLVSRLFVCDMPKQHLRVSTCSVRYRTS